MYDGVIKKLDGKAINEYRALPFWSWNDELEEKKLVKQIEWMKKAGFGGFFMHARGGLKTEYMGEKWFSCIKSSVNEGDRLGLASWAYDENGWPSGFAGGKLLENHEFKDRYLTYSTGKFDKTAYAAFLVTENELVYVKTEEQSKGKADIFPDNRGFLNVYINISASTADILNKKVVKEFIELTHEQYKKRLGKDFGTKLKGFFTDEPQYYRNGQPYTLELEKYFQENYGENIKEKIGLLFEEKIGWREFRYKFWNAMHELMLDSYAKQIYEWCDDNGVSLTGHYIEESSLIEQMSCCAGITSFYEYEHIVGIDWLGRRTDTPVTPRQAASVARQLGKKQVLGEIYAMCGWDVTPRDLKTITEWLFVYGVNLVCQHLVPYSEYGQRKRDYPAHYSEYNPWVKKDFKSFNDYFARLGYLLGESEEMVSTGIFVPITSMYLDYKRYEPKEYETDKSYRELASKFGRANVSFHVLDEKILQKYGRVNGNKLVVGNCSYEYVVFPKTLTIGVSSAKLFEEFYAAGGKMLFTEGVPEYLEWNRHEYTMKSTVTFEEISATQPYAISDKNTAIASTMHCDKDGRKFIFAANTSFDNGYTVTFSGDFKSFDRLNLETLKTENIGTELHFNAGDSYVLFLSEKDPKTPEKAKRIVFDGEFIIENASDNFMLLDKPRYSINAIDYGEKTRYMGILDELLKKRYKGEIYLKYEFNVKDIPEKMFFGYEDMNVKTIELNGVRANNAIFDKADERYYINISKTVKEGVNEVVLTIDFYESEKTYYALFGEGVTETMKNCLAYETTIEACVIKGDFGVYSDSGFYEGKEKNVLISDGDFYIGRRKDVITDAVKEGYPFFAGHMTFVKEFEWDGSDCVIDLNGRYCLSYVEINGNPVVKSYFGKTADISEFVKKGKNVAKITLFSSNRNLLGPHHLAEAEESFLVGPFSWEKQGSWENGKSNEERESYSFVKFGLFKD